MSSSDPSDQIVPLEATEPQATDPHDPPDSGWLTDQAPRPRITRRLAEDRVSLPGARRTVYSQEHDQEVQVDPWFAPDGTVRGGVLILLPEGIEQVIDAAKVTQLLGEDGLRDARARLGILGPSEDVSDYPTAPSAAVPPGGHLRAEEDSQGIPHMPDSFPMRAGDLGLGARDALPESGAWGFDPEFDETHGLVSGTLLRNARKAGKRAWPLVLLGAGWLWGRAKPHVQQIASRMPWPIDWSGAWRTGRTTPLGRLRSRTVIAIGIGALLILTLSLCGVLSILQHGNQLGVTGLPGNPVDANATIANAATATETSVEATATASAIIAGGGIPPTAVPTPTRSAATPTPTPSGFCIIFCGGPNPTPTSTRPPGPTPTPTANPFAPSASVSFTRSFSTAQAPSTLVTYDGAADDAPGGSTRGQKLSAGPTTQSGGSWGNNWTQTAGATNSIIEVEYSCDSSLHELCTAPAGTRLSDQSGNGNDCHTLADVTTDTTTVALVQCQLYTTGPITNSQVYYFGDRAPCGASCSASWLKAQYTDVLGSNAQYAYFTPNPCSGDGGAAARSNVAGALAMGTGLGADAIAQQTNFSNGGYCANPANCGAWGDGWNVGGTSSYTMCASGSAWKLTYSPSGAQTVQKARITPPSGYATDTSTISVCSGVTVQSTDLANQRATLSCPASATARYVWTSPMLSTLGGQIAGKTPAQATTILAATAGIAAGTIQVSIPGGYSSLPSDPNAITITVN